MKKIVTLVLALALLLTSVVAIAESTEVKSKATPNINTFAKMTTKFHEISQGSAKYWEIKLSKPVDKLWVLWAEKGAEPEELAVDENLCATALGVEHKYMPGITQTIGTATAKDTIKQKVNLKYDVETSEYLFTGIGETKTEGKRDDGGVYFIETTTEGPTWKVYANQYKDSKGKVQVEYRVVEVMYDEKGKEVTQTIFYTDNMDYVNEEYLKTYSSFDEVVSTAPEKVTTTAKETNKWGEKEEVKKDVKQWDDSDWSYYKVGEVYGVKKEVEVNTKKPTNKATLADRAFATLENGFLVYRNRKGNLVAIEPYEGQL